MEIKKYVLLKNNTVVKFFENNKFGFSYVEKEQDGIIFTRSALISDVKLTSDNILDLIEVGDLVKTLYDSTIFEVGAIEDEIFYQKKHELKAYFNDVKAIYKRQPNGDYKRYDVENNV